MSNQRVKAAIAKIDAALQIIEGGGGDSIEELRRRDKAGERETARYEALSRRYDELIEKRNATFERMRDQASSRIKRRDQMIEELRRQLEEQTKAGGADRFDTLRREHALLKRRYAALREEATTAVVQLDSLLVAARAEAG